MVENKRLGAVLTVIQAAQVDRDRQRLASKKLTWRAKDRIASKRAVAGVEPRPAKVRPKLKPVPSSEGRLDAMLADLKAFGEEQRAKKKLQNVKATLRRRAERGLGITWPVEVTSDSEQPC